MLCQLLQQFAPGRLTQAMPLISQPTRPVCVRVKWLSMHSTSHETTAASGLPGIALSRKCVRRMSAVISRHGVESPVRHPSANSELYTGLFGNLRRLPTPQARRECAASTKDLNVPLADTVPDTVLIVESKTKANKIQKYLGPAFKVHCSTYCLHGACCTMQVILMPNIRCLLYSGYRESGAYSRPCCQGGFSGPCYKLPHDLERGHSFTEASGQHTKGFAAGWDHTLGAGYRP